jgi:hypothetical protein
MVYGLLFILTNPEPAEGLNGVWSEDILIREAVPEGEVFRRIRLAFMPSF